MAGRQRRAGSSRVGDRKEGWRRRRRYLQTDGGLGLPKPSISISQSIRTVMSRTPLAKSCTVVGWVAAAAAAVAESPVGAPLAGSICAVIRSLVRSPAETAPASSESRIHHCSRVHLQHLPAVENHHCFRR